MRPIGATSLSERNAVLRIEAGRDTPADHAAFAAMINESPLLSRIDAEQAVLSAMLADSGAIAAVSGILDESVFEKPAEQKIFRAILALFLRQSAVDPITVCAELENCGDLELAGGKDQISYLIDIVPSAANVSHHADLVRDAAFRRRIRHIACKVALEIGQPGRSPMDIATEHQQKLTDATFCFSPTPQSRISLLSNADLLKLEDPSWLVDGILPSKCLIQLFGEPGSMKTFVAFDLSCHIAWGLSWAGRQTQQGAVVYICAEGGHGIKQRLSAWKKFHDLAGNLPVFILRNRIAMASDHPDITALMTEIRVKVRPAPVLVVVDTLARNLEGNENAVEDMNSFVAGCDALRYAFDCAVLVVHHSGYGEAGRSRGSSALRGALDTDIQCTRDGDRVTLECKKQKDAAEFPQLSFESVPVSGSLALKSIDQFGGRLNGNRLICLKTLHRLGESTHSGWKKETKLGGSSFATARNWLLHEVYVRKNGKTTYVVTAAGLQVLSPSSTASPSSVHLPAVHTGPSRGGLVDPAVD